MPLDREPDLDLEEITARATTTLAEYLAGRATSAFADSIVLLRRDVPALTVAVRAYARLFDNQRSALDERDRELVEVKVRLYAQEKQLIKATRRIARLRAKKAVRR